MTQEKKDLLLKDLCARLPYNIKVRGVFLNYNTNKAKILYEECDKELNCQDLKHYESLKPYLRPMSSMTEEEIKEFKAFHCVDEWHPEFYQVMCNLPNINNMIDWLNAHHFDYRGLIPMGLALEASKNMYK